MALKPRQQLFVQEYLVDKNATRAAIASGYSKKTSYSIGQRLLKNVEIRAAVDAGIKIQQEKLAKRAEKKLVTKERIIERLAQIGFANHRDFAIVTDKGGVKLVPSSKRSRKKDLAIKKISESESQFGGSKSLELHDPRPSLELIAKMCGWIVDKHEHSGADGGPIHFTVEFVDGPATSTKKP